MKRMGKALEIIFYICSIALFAWIAISYIDIIADNLSGAPVHYDWNFFKLLTGQ